MKILSYKEAWMASLILNLLHTGSRHNKPLTYNWLYNAVWQACKQDTGMVPNALMNHKRNSHELMLAMVNQLAEWQLLSIHDAPEPGSPFNSLSGWHGVGDDFELSARYQVELFTDISIDGRAVTSRTYAIQPHAHQRFVMSDAQWQAHIEAIQRNPQYHDVGAQVIYYAHNYLIFLLERHQASEESSKALFVTGTKLVGDLKRSLFRNLPFVSPLVVLAFLELPFTMTRLGLQRIDDASVARTDSIYYTRATLIEQATQHECIQALQQIKPITASPTK